jgi:hypothetical protein
MIFMPSKMDYPSSNKASSSASRDIDDSNYFTVNRSKGVYEKPLASPIPHRFGHNGFQTDEKDKITPKTCDSNNSAITKYSAQPTNTQSIAAYLMNISDDLINLTKTLKEKFFNHNTVVREGAKYFTYEFCHQQVLIHSYSNSVQKELQDELETAGKGSFIGITLLLAEILKLCVDVRVAYKMVRIEHMEIELLLRKQGLALEEMMIWVMKVHPLSSV